MIKAIVFDYGGVIEIFKPDFNKEVVDYLKIKEEDWDNVYFSLNYLCNTGQKTYEEVYALTAKELGASDEQILKVLEIKKNNKETNKINFKLIEIIKKLRNANYKIGLLSNNYISLRKELENLKLIDLFDSIVVSGEVGYYKPQPKIFEILFNELRVKNTEIIFIDDTENSLKGAKEIGYTPILFTTNEKLKEDLKNLGVNL